MIDDSMFFLLTAIGWLCMIYIWLKPLFQYIGVGCEIDRLILFWSINQWMVYLSTAISENCQKMHHICWIWLNSFQSGIFNTSGLCHHFQLNTTIDRFGSIVYITLLTLLPYWMCCCHVTLSLISWPWLCFDVVRIA